jgi:radical SAM protein
MPDAHPDQLTHVEAYRLLEQIASFGNPLPHLVLTGGDPLERPHLFDLIAHAQDLGLKVSITPAATPKLSRAVLQRLAESGIDSVAFSLDGSNAARHDAIRQVPGCFERTVRAAKWAGELGLPLQINTLVCEETCGDLPAVYELMHTFPLMRWSLFFLIAIGRGTQLNELPPKRGEELMKWVYELAQHSPFQIKTTEAPSYRRIAHERMVGAGMSSQEMRATSVHRGYGIRDGNGVVFVSHDGDVYPSGFLPQTAGNVRLQNLAEIYRDSEVFRTVRDVDGFEGKCGHCEYRKMCGGSRARAYAHTGNPAASDPFCAYQPKVDARELAVTGSR